MHTKKAFKYNINNPSWPSWWKNR